MEAPLVELLHSRDQIEALCRDYGVRRLAVYGSILRDDFSADSDVDLLVEFHPGVRTGLRLFELQERLSDLIGRHVDLNTVGFLSRRFREQVQAEARLLYVAA